MDNKNLNSTMPTERPAAVPAVPVSADELKPLAPKTFVVNCLRCGAAVRVKDNANVLYICPVCNNRFQIRKMEKRVKEILPVEEEAKAWIPPVEEAVAPVEETPVEEAVAPVEETPVEEAVAPVEETPVEEQLGIELPEEEKAVEPDWKPIEDEAEEEADWDKDVRDERILEWEEDEPEAGWDEEE